MQRIKIFTIILVSVLIVVGLIFVSCERPMFVGIPPVIVTKNIQFTPKSGKVGDIITITGEDFLPSEDMEELYGLGRTLATLVIFNCEMSDDITTWLWPMYPEHTSDVLGAPSLEPVSFDTNLIRCKVPPNAKSGKIVVSLYLGDTIHDWDYINPSEEIFTVLDASGDPVYDNTPDLLRTYY